MKVKEFIEKYGEEAYLQKLERDKQYRESHKKEIAEYRKQHREELNEYSRQYHQEHREENNQRRKEYYQNHREQALEYSSLYYRQYYSTPYGRAVGIVSSNNKKDRGRGFDTSQNVDAQWIVDNVFSGQSCIYCGESDWTKLGVDRIDNSLPHIASNLNPCCRSCNSARQDLRSVEEHIQYTNQKNRKP